MNREQIRNFLVDGLQRVLDHPVIAGLDREQKDVVTALKTALASDDGTILGRVESLMRRRSDPPTETPT